MAEQSAASVSNDSINASCWLHREGGCSTAMSNRWLNIAASSAVSDARMRLKGIAGVIPQTIAG